MNDNLTNQEKINLSYDAINVFLEEFKPLDKHSVILLEMIFAMLMGAKNE